jgi:hypothetical protein
MAGAISASSRAIGASFATSNSVCISSTARVTSGSIVNIWLLVVRRFPDLRIGRRLQQPTQSEVAALLDLCFLPVVIPMTETLPKAIRACIFCGGKPLTKEHIWSEWTYRYVPRDPSAHHRRSVFRGVAGIRGLDNSKRHQGLTNALKVKAVCRSCNSGWMSGLDNRVQPVLAPFMLDNPSVLTVEKQHILSAWLTMKCMVYEMSIGNQDDVVASPSERQFMMDRLAPPDTWRVWVGRQTGRRFRAGV